MSGILSLPQGRIAPRRLDLAAFSSRPDADCHAGAVHAYLGVPFAQPPLGALRWRAPQGPSPSWEGVRQSSFAPDPAQLDGLGTAAWPHREGLRHSEDCLYLNVWVPQRVPHQGGKRPILFAIYGGSFVSGGASMAMHDGARLAHESNCIVVGCNYRLGVFGFLGSRALAAEAEGAGCGNYAMHDCIAALQWVQANAEHLGGDRENVTLFGQSAGSIMQHYLLISPATPAALFQRVILQSGVVTTVMPRTLPSAQATFEALLPEDGPDDDASRLAKLRAMDATQLLHAAAALPAARPRTEYEVNEAEGRPLDRAGSQDVRMAPSSLWGPVWDGVAVSKDFERLSKAVIPAAGEARKNGQGGIMLGYAIDEGTLFCPLIQTKEQLDAHIAGFNPTLQPALRKTYGADSVTDEVAWAVCSDYTGSALFQAPVRAAMGALVSKQAPPAYGYVFAHAPSKDLLRSWAKNSYGFELLGKMSALHCADLPYLWGGDGTERHIWASGDAYGVAWDAPAATEQPALDETQQEGRGFTPAERQLSLHIMRCLSTFAHGGSPWTPLSHSSSSSSSPADLLIHPFGDRAQFGALSSAARQSYAADEGARAWGAIETRDRKLGEMLAWKERVGSDAADADAKHRFWTDEENNSKLLYYGNRQQGYLP